MPPKISKEQMEEIQAYLQTLPEDQRESKLNEILSKLDAAPQCPFCLMADSKIPTTKVYDDPNYLAVLEINPANPGHVILFPRSHILSLVDLSHSDIENLFKISKIIASSISTFSDGVTLFTEDGKLTGKRFDHFLINIIPRLKDDDITLVTKPKTSTPEKLQEMREKILSNLPKEKKEDDKSKPKIDDSILHREFNRLRRRMP